MSEKQRSTLVGLFVLLGCFGLGGLIIVFGEQPEILGARSYRVAVTFDDLEGVTRGMRVTMRGIRIGEIQDMALTPTGVRVVMRIEEQYSLTEKTEALVKSSIVGFGQASFIVAVPRDDPGAPLPKDGTAEIRGRMMETSIVPERSLAALENTVIQIGRLAETLKPVAEDLHGILQQRTIAQVDAPTTPNVTATLATAVQRLDKLLKHFNDVMGDPAVQSNFKEAIENITTVSRDAKEISANLKDFSAQAKEAAAVGTQAMQRFDTAIANADQKLTTVAEKVQRVVDRVSGVLDHVDKTTRNIAEGKGVLGRLAFDEKLYEELLLTTKRLKILVKDFSDLVQQWKTEGLF